MNTKKPVFPALWIGLVALLVIQGALLSGCGQFEAWRNDSPEITTLTLPKEVPYGETVIFRVRVFDAENDDLTYAWEVSEGFLVGEAGPEIEWKAPDLPFQEIAPPRMVKVQVFVNDGGEEDVSSSASIIVYSKAYNVAAELSGVYQLIRTEIDGQLVEDAGILRLTETTFIQEFENGNQFLVGSYQLIEPFNNRQGTIHWFIDGNAKPSVSTYTSDGKLLVLFFEAPATRYIYQK